MFKKLVSVCVVFIFVLSLAGCATGRKQKDLEIQGLRNQVTLLETQVESKDDEINSLKDALAKADAERLSAQPAVEKASKRKKVVFEIKSRPKAKQIQIALRNAGLNPGAIDGRMGKATRQAIKDFQMAHNLPVDGKCGDKTWELLRPYLYQKIK